MAGKYDIRPHEVAVTFPEEMDAGITFIGRIRTPWTDRLDCPRQGRPDGPVCRIEIFEPWTPALQGIDAFEQLEGHRQVNGLVGAKSCDVFLSGYAVSGAAAISAQAEKALARAARYSMAESVLRGKWKRLANWSWMDRNLWTCRSDLNLFMIRSRRRVGRCEFSARLLSP